MKTSATVRFGRNLKEIRVAGEYTQAQVAEAVDLTPRYLAELEAGTKTPSLLTVLRLAKAMKVPTSKLLVGLESLIEVPNESALTVPRIDRRKTRGARPLR
jgi:transcriptional regulator with XRE-family HTH domain